MSTALFCVGFVILLVGFAVVIKNYPTSCPQCGTKFFQQPGPCRKCGHVSWKCNG